MPTYEGIADTKTFDSVTASNGITISYTDDGFQASPPCTDGAFVVALGEFFQRQRDRELNRWRDGDFVYYEAEAKDGFRHAYRVNEGTGRGMLISEGSEFGNKYFKATRQPLPEGVGAVIEFPADGMYVRYAEDRWVNSDHPSVYTDDQVKTFVGAMKVLSWGIEIDDEPEPIDEC